MIDATQVRIGNWVQDWAGSVFKQVCDISTDLVECEWNNGGFYVEPHPIPLTSDILERCGFKKWGVEDKNYPGEVFYHKDPMQTDRLMWSAYEKRVCFCTDTYQELGHRVFYRPTVDYLHELQNTFFVFYSEELSISL